MTDDLIHHRAPSDRSRINMDEAWEIRWWCVEFGVTEDELRQAWVLGVEHAMGSEVDDAVTGERAAQHGLAAGLEGERLQPLRRRYQGLQGVGFGAGVGGATPLPPVCGATEATLTGMLVLTGYPPTKALVVVLVFRVATYWLPVPFGVVAARRLRARGLL